MKNKYLLYSFLRWSLYLLFRRQLLQTLLQWLKESC